MQNKQLMIQIDLILSNRLHWKLNNDIESVLCGSTHPWAEHVKCSEVIYTQCIHALSFRPFLWMGHILPLIMEPRILSSSYFKCFSMSYKTPPSRVCLNSTCWLQLSNLLPCLCRAAFIYCGMCSSVSKSSSRPHQQMDSVMSPMSVKPLYCPENSRFTLFTPCRWPLSLDLTGESLT